ncbi:TPA: hypothetical protein DEP21_01295 [Patescibacteria group bacterium]|nr:hypothetical protein [Candidatus Gracilibacteria bacterium]
MFYIDHNPNRGECYIDADVTEDSNGDNNPLNDSDFSCNELYMKTYEAKYDSVDGRLYYTNKQGKLLSKDFSVGFVDFEASLDAETKKVYDQLNVLLKDMNGPQWLTGTDKTFKDMIKSLKNNIADKATTMANVVSLKDFMSKNTINLTKDQETILTTVFLELSNRSTAAAEGLGEYGIAKADILSLLPINLAVEIDALFKQFESVA